MAYRHGEREQVNMFPKSIEEYVAEDDPVRVYDAFVETIKLEDIGIVLKEDKVGNPEYDPKAMIKLLVYGYSYGIRSSRKLERALNHNVSFIWLMGGLKPDHKTIARFRKDNKKSLKHILKQCARLCIKLGLIEGNTLFVDGSKIRANASISNTWTQDKCKRYLKRIDERIDSILAECDRIDEEEQDNSSLVKLKEELKGNEKLKAKVQNIMNELNEKEVASMNSTDPECVKVRSRQGSHAGYNGQIVVDKKNGLIVSSDVVNQNNDANQFTNQIEQANKTLGKKCKNACADAGYTNVDDLKKIDDQGICVIVPSQEQAHNLPRKPFVKEQFDYDIHNDCYICPEGHKLPYYFYDKNRKHKVYQISDKNICFACRHYGICTNAKCGRRTRRLANEETKLKLKKQYEKEQSQEIYKLRKEKVELPFGHIKRNLGVVSFLLKGCEGVKAEMSLFASCFNIARMIGILGTPALIAKLESLT